MGNVIRLPDDPHAETQLLLPWYAAGRLDAQDRVRVEAHLAACPRCRSELAMEQRLEREVASLPVDADLGWAAMRRSIEASAAGAGWVSRLGHALAMTWRGAGPWLGWGAAAGVTIVLASGPWVAPRPAPYHTLSARPSPSERGNAIVVFRADATTAAMSRALAEAHARVVDGPTRAGAYVLRIPAAERADAVARLQGQSQVEMAAPVDGPGSS